MLYQFKTAATMKPYNNKKWWIDSGIIREVTTEAATMGEALKKYQEAVKEQYYIDISDNAIKNKCPMYRDTNSGGDRLMFTLICILIIPLVVLAELLKISR